MDEAHVEHAVSFVEHQHFDGRQIDVALLRVVEQPSGGGDQNVDAAFQGRNLRIHADTAEHDQRLQG